MGRTAADDRTPPRPGPSVGSRLAITSLLGVLVLLAVLSVAFEAVGQGARWDPRARDEGPVVVRTTDELSEEWDRRGIRNAVLVCASRDLGFEPVPFESMVASEAAYPVDLVDVRTLYAAKSDRASHLWVAAQRGVFRTIHYILPAAELSRRVEEGRAAGFPGIARDGRSVRANNDGYLRTIEATAPRLTGPVVLVVEASYFESGEPPELVRELEASDLDIRLVFLDRAVDDATTTETARRKLDAFAAEWGRRQ